MGLWYAKCQGLALRGRDGAHGSLGRVSQALGRSVQLEADLVRGAPPWAQFSASQHSVRASGPAPPSRLTAFYQPQYTPMIADSKHYHKGQCPEVGSDEYNEMAGVPYRELLGALLYAAELRLWGTF